MPVNIDEKLKERILELLEKYDYSYTFKRYEIKFVRRWLTVSYEPPRVTIDKTEGLPDFFRAALILGGHAPNPEIVKQEKEEAEKTQKWVCERIQEGLNQLKYPYIIESDTVEDYSHPHLHHRSIHCKTIDDEGFRILSKAFNQT